MCAQGGLDLQLDVAVGDASDDEDGDRSYPHDMVRRAADHCLLVCFVANKTAANICDEIAGATSSTSTVRRAYQLMRIYISLSDARLVGAQAQERAYSTPKARSREKKCPLSVGTPRRESVLSPQPSRI